MRLFSFQYLLKENGNVGTNFNIDRFFVFFPYKTVFLISYMVSSVCSFRSVSGKSGIR